MSPNPIVSFYNEARNLFAFLTQAASLAIEGDYKKLDIMLRVFKRRSPWQIGTLVVGVGTIWLLYRNVNLDRSTWFKTRADNVTLKGAEKAVIIAHSKSEQKKRTTDKKNYRLGNNETKLRAASVPVTLKELGNMRAPKVLNHSRANSSANAKNAVRSSELRRRKVMSSNRRRTVAA